jgi:hypothetical protein
LNRTEAPAKTISLPAAVLLSWLLAGALNAVAIGLLVPLPPRIGGRLLHHAFDAGQFIAPGLLLAGLSGAYLRWGDPRPAMGFAMVLALSALVGTSVLPPDLENAAGRMTEGMGGATAGGLLALGTGLISLLVPLVGLFARRLARPRWRWPAVTLGGILLGGNGFLLQYDYPGVHVFVTLLGTTMVAAALAGTELPSRLASPWERLAQKKHLGTASLALASLYSAASLIVPPPPTVAARMLHCNGSVLPPYLGRWHHGRPVPPVEVPPEWQEWFADRRSAPPQPPTSPRFLPDNPVVILISIDSLRADVINSGRYDDRLPTLAALRKRSVQFTNASAPGSQTVYSLTEMFAGTYYSEQTWSLLNGNLVPHEYTTKRFPEFLRGAGVQTVHMASAPWFTNNVGVVRGFAEETYIKPPVGSYAHAKPLMDALLGRLSQVAQGPAFFYAHFLDPHFPYNRSPVEGSLFDKYLGEVAQVDVELARLMRWMSVYRQADRTLLIVTADHGEAFGEHDTYQHAVSLYEELVRVPLLVHMRGLRPREVQAQVSLMDLGPTILDLFGQPTPGHFMGQSLVPFLRGEDRELSRPLVAEGRLKKSLRMPDGMKVIADDYAHTLELYDLVHDPDELINLADDQDKLARPLGLLRQFFAVHTNKTPGYKVPYRR